ncbi:MAG: hypothetical protein LC734_04810 [Acidobacteria bacterium]|nr:hypothetical protein [Acidobacteriota bacterium]
MEMSPEDQKALRIETARELQIRIIQLLHAAGEVGLPRDRIKRGLIANAYGVDDDTLKRNLKFLSDEKLIATKGEDRLRPDLIRWLSTSEGDKLLMREGLI